MQAPATLHSNLVLIGIGNGVALGSGLTKLILIYSGSERLLTFFLTIFKQQIDCSTSRGMVVFLVRKVLDVYLLKMVRYQPRSGGYGGYVAWP